MRRTRPRHRTTRGPFIKPEPVVARIVSALERHHPDADTELVYRNPFELLVATILSAQSTDARVNSVTPALFAKFPDAHALARAEAAEVERLIHATGFFRQKARSLIGMAQTLVERHGGRVPASMEALTALPGVGRKTANVVLGHAFGVPALPVDRHVLRVANRLGLARAQDPEKVEASLGALVPRDRWTKLSDMLILHGRRICRPKPLCQRCHCRPDCDYARAGGIATRPIGNRRRSARPAPPRARRAPRAGKSSRRR